MKSKKLFTMIFAIQLAFATLPASANLQGGVFKTNFIDTSDTISVEIKPETKIKLSKYWDTNFFCLNRYRPLFMLSNKDLIKLMPEHNQSVVERIMTPSVYSISFRNSSITHISLKSQPVIPLKFAKKYSPIITHNENIPTKTISIKNPEIKTITPPKDTTQLRPTKIAKEESCEDLIKKAVMLKNTKKSANYTTALNILNQVLKKEPKNVTALIVKGDIYYQKGEMENSMQNYANAVRINPLSKDGCLGIAKILEQTDKMLAQKYFARANSL